MPTGSTKTRGILFLLARLVVGIVFVAHGLQKFLQWGIGGSASTYVLDSFVPRATCHVPRATCQQHAARSTQHNTTSTTAGRLM